MSSGSPPSGHGEPSGLAALRDRLAWESGRIADRLRGLSGPRLQADLPGYGSPAEAGRQAAQLLAELGQGLEERAQTAEPDWRTVPPLGAEAVGDQVAVTGNDAVAALDEYVQDGTPTGPELWTRTGRSQVIEAVTDVLERLAAIRLAVN